MSRTHRHRVLEKADSLCRFPIQRRTQPLEKSSELSDRETSIEETSWSSVSSADSPKNARRYYDEKQASLVIVTESFTSSCSGSKESDTFFSAPSWRTQSKYEDPLTLSTLSTTPKTTETPKATVVEAKSSSGSCENFGAVSSYDDFTTNTVTEETSSGSYGVTSLSATPLLASESATSELSSSGWTLSSVGSLNVISSRRSWIDSKENKSRLRGGKARSACTKESKDSCSQRSPETIPSSASLGSIYYADKLTTCLNGKCRVFAFDRVNCLCNEAQSPADARCKKTRTGQGEKKAKDAYKKVPKSYTTPVEQPALLAKSCTSQRLIVNRRPLIEPPILNENHSWRYVGVLTHEEAPKAVRNKTDFRLYHQYIPGMDYTGVERLPLAVVYQSSKKRIYHWRVHTLGTFVEKRGKSVYNCEYYYIELGGPTCRSLNDLLDVYSDHAYNIDGHIENFFFYE